MTSSINWKNNNVSFFPQKNEIIYSLAATAEIISFLSPSSGVLNSSSHYVLNTIESIMKAYFFFYLKKFDLKKRKLGSS